MGYNLPLSSIIEVALQNATSHKQVAYCLKLSATIELLERCYQLDSASR